MTAVLLYTKMRRGEHGGYANDGTAAMGTSRSKRVMRGEGKINLGFANEVRGGLILGGVRRMLDTTTSVSRTCVREPRHGLCSLCTEVK